MKLQPASRKELSRIALGTLACDAVMIAALFLLSLVGVGTFEPFRILLGAACGSIVAVVNFALLCLTVQSAVEIENKKKMKARFQLSYNIRLLLQAGTSCSSPATPPPSPLLRTKNRKKTISDHSKFNSSFIMR